ncbi:uncharacterized protein [Macrobrachium rosenbergii]|uniref:uncharacterized protein isoform X3 n=1 Tax=Macrobrachium rosenbergii TaxID=79674 RepID=UPI0034D4405C
MGATQAPLKGCQSSHSVASIAWVGQDRLRPTHLRATLTRLLQRESEEWEPLTFGYVTGQVEEVDMMAREIAVRWQGEACSRLGWTFETRFTAAAFLDLLLHRVRITPRYLHAVAAAAVFLAAKLHEEDENVPSTLEVVERGKMGCSHRELLRMERVLLDKMSWYPKSSFTLDFLQVLHALAIVTGPKHQQGNRSGSPTRQLSQLTERLWEVVCSGHSGSIRPSLMSLSVLSLDLDASTPEPGLILWLQALVQIASTSVVSDKATSEKPDESDDTYYDIRRLYASPVPVRADCTQLKASVSPGNKTITCDKKKKKKKKTKPTFKSKSAVRSCLKQAFKIPCKISLISTKKIFEDLSEEGEEEEDMELGEEWEGPLIEPVGILRSPVFSPMSPEFPDIRHLIVKKEDMCWQQHAQEVTEQIYRPLTYAQVLRLHLTPLTQALGV